MEKWCCALHLFTDSGSTMNLFLCQSRVVPERKRGKKTDSTQKQVIYTDQPLFPQRLLTFLPYVTISNQCLND